MNYELAYQDEHAELYRGDARELAPKIGPVDLVVLDPPYGVTSLAWDVASRVFLDIAAQVLVPSGSLWLFGSMRSLLELGPQLAAWHLADDVVWEKHNGSGLRTDRFRCVHEHAIRLYRGRWSDVWHASPTTNVGSARVVRKQARPAHWQGERGAGVYTSRAGGPKLIRSVISLRSMHRRGGHPTEKPPALLRPLIEAACPPGGLVLDMCAGSGSTLVAAKACGRRSVGIEIDPKFCAYAARRLAQENLELKAASS